MLTEDGILAYSRRKNVLKFGLKDKFGILTLDPMCGVFPINLEQPRCVTARPSVDTQP